VRLYVEHVEVWYAQKETERLPRLRGRKKHRINYRHIIDWLVRKPGAFEELSLPGKTFSHQPLFAWPTMPCGKRKASEVSKEYLGIPYPGGTPERDGGG